MKTYLLDGRKMTDLDGFYDEIQRVLCPNFEFFGRNLDAFNDILRGGFGGFEEDEPIKIVIEATDQIERGLGSRKFEIIKEILADHEHITVEYLL
jgi:RNAse (barnase) inhibitor barstar